MAKLNPFRVGQEHECEEVLLTRTKRRPVDYYAENAYGVSCVLRKGAKGTREWAVLLPGGGLHMFKTKRAACRFINRLREIDDAESN